MRKRRRAVAAAVAIVSTLALAGCGARTVQGTPTVVPAADVHLDVVGVDPASSFDQTVQNSLSDIEAFWKKQFPKVSGGRALEPLAGGLFSVDGAQVFKTHELPAEIEKNACAQEDKAFVVDNGAFCRLDDSIAWDRSPDHLLSTLADHYGKFVVGLIFAHEFGHAISYRLGVFNRHLPTIDTESQADCAAGAWAASAIAHQDPHFPDVTPQTLDDALIGFLNGRDSVPGAPQDVSHGNGFDRLSAVADGLAHGVTYCYSSTYFDRTFTERPYTDGADYDAGGNETLTQVVSAHSGQFSDLNAFWAQKAATLGKTFTPVKVVEADHPRCGASDSASEFGYCPDDNTVYYSSDFAHDAYYSLSSLDLNQDTADVTLSFHQPADYALGELFSVAWGLAVRHQVFGGTTVDTPALQAAVCYSGAYAKTVNVPFDGTQRFVLSPSDLDEAVSGLLDVAGKRTAFGSRETTGLDRIQAFVKGYNDKLSSC